MEYLYYKVTKGPVWDAVETLRDERVAAIDNLHDFCERVGAVEGDFYGNERHISALKFKTCPDGWKPEPGAYGYFSPKGSSKEAMALRKELGSLAIPGPERLQELLGLHYFSFMHGRRIYQLQAEDVGSTLILMVPDVPNKDGDGPKWVPLDCEPLKKSEYWALKEANPTEPDQE